MGKEINKNKIVVFTGAGISAESGLKTFRDSGGLWNDYVVEDVATVNAWIRNPRLVLDFYNERRNDVRKAEPNAAHLAIAELQSKYEVIVVTQNVDDLHERAGSKNVIHVHGEITKARSCSDDEQLFDIGYEPIKFGQLCENGNQIRPHIVWFGEDVIRYDESRDHFKTAGRILVVGTSLTVYPVANLLKQARHRAEKVIVALDVEKIPFGYTFIRAKAANMVPHITQKWLDGTKVRPGYQ